MESTAIAVDGMFYQQAELDLIFIFQRLNIRKHWVVANEFVAE